MSTYDYLLKRFDERAVEIAKHVATIQAYHRRTEQLNEEIDTLKAQIAELRSDRDRMLAESEPDAGEARGINYCVNLVHPNGEYSTLVFEGGRLIRITQIRP